MNIPNVLTVIRFFLIGIFVYVFYLPLENNLNLKYAALVFVTAGVTDLLDGYIARKYNMITKWGKLLDPLADKLMILTVLYCLTSIKLLPFFVVLIVLGKELIMIAGAVVLYKKDDVVVGSRWYGKAATVSFFIAIIFLMFNLPKAYFILWVAVIMGILSLANYMVSFVKFKKTNKKLNL